MTVECAIEDGRPIAIEDEGRLFKGWYFGVEEGLWAFYVNAAGLLQRRWVDAHPSEFGFMAPLALSMLVHAEADAADSAKAVAEDGEAA